MHHRHRKRVHMGFIQEYEAMLNYPAAYQSTKGSALDVNKPFTAASPKSRISAS